MKIIPAIDIISGKTVRLRKGDYAAKISYDISPIDAARKWESLGAELIHVVDLDGAKEGKPVNSAVIFEIIKAVKVPIEVGGGFRNERDIKDALANGARRVVVGTKAIEDFDFAGKCIKDFSGKIILSIDAKNFQLRLKGWEEGARLDFSETLKKIISLGAEEIIYTDIERDGTLAGPNIGNLKKIMTEFKVRVISAGGVKTAEDVRELKKLESLGLVGVIIGRALYDGTLDFKEAVDAGKANCAVS